METSEAVEEMLANAEQSTSESLVMELEQTGAFLVDYHKVKSMDLHGFEHFFFQTGQTIVIDEGSSESLMVGGQCREGMEIGQGQFFFSLPKL